MEKEAASEKNPEKEVDFDQMSRKSVKSAYKYTGFNALMGGFGESFISAFATFLKASNFQFTLLSSLPQFIGGIIQLFTFNVLKLFKSRKFLAILLTLLQGLIWIPILYLGFIHSSNVVWYFLLLIVMYFAISLMISPVWNSWIMDIIANEERGEYLSKKKFITDVTGLISFVIGGILIYGVDSIYHSQVLGFAILFFMAFIFNVLGIIFLLRIYEPKFELTKPKTNFTSVFKDLRLDSQGWVIIYLSLMSFAIYIASPFYTPYLLKSLGFNYVQFAIIIVTPIIVRLLFIKKLGALIDRYGPRKLLKISNLLIAFIPVMWVFSGNFWYLIAIQVYGGFVFGLYEMCVAAYLLNSTTPESRVTILTYYNFFNGLMIVLGALCSNFALFIGPYKDLYLNTFLISTILRLAILFIPFPKVKESDAYEKIKYSKLMGKIIGTLSPKKLFERPHSKAYEQVSIKLMDNNVIIAKTGPYEYIKESEFNAIRNENTIKRKERKEEGRKRKKKLKREYVYKCNSCNTEFKRFSYKKNAQCHYCGSNNTKLIREELDAFLENIK